MANNYFYKFNIHDIFKTSDEQKIFIGSPKENSNQFVIINILNDKRFLQPEVKEQLQSLDNLVYFEELGGGIVLVTSFNKAVYLEEYIKENKLNLEERLDLANQYLKGITKYDDFSNELRSSLVEETQLAIRNGVLLFNELLIIDEEQADSSTDTSFKKVAQKVGTVLNAIIFSNTSFFSMKRNNSNEIMEFINSLGYGNHQHQSLSEIYNHFLKIYGSDIYLKPTKEEVDALWGEAYTISKNREFNKKPTAGLTIALVGTILVGLAITGFAIGTIGKSKISQDKFQSDITYLQENQMEDSGEIITSNITDDHQESSELIEEYNTVNYSLENLDKFDISYSTSESIVMDRDVFRNGEYAIKLISSSENPVKNFSLNNIIVHEDSVLSLWMMTDIFEEIKFIFQGYDNNDNLKFDRSIFYTPKVVGTWEMIHFNLTAEDITTLEIFIFSENATIWIDDIKIDSYK